jgi:hypothetical protein
MGVDCVPTDFPTGRTNSGSLLHGCVTDEPFGKVGNSYFLNGPQGTLKIELSNRGFFLPQSAHGLVTFNFPSSWLDGAAINIGNKVASSPIFTREWGWPMKEYYKYEIIPEKTLSDASGKGIHFDWESVAYSPNGEWMVALTTNGGIMLYDTATFQGKTIGWNRGNMFYGEAKGNNLAVSNDGQYVAINANLASAATTPIPTLRVYDATTCIDQAKYVLNQKAGSPCYYKDLWTGAYNGLSTGGIAAEHPELEYPRHVRFTGDGSITFDSVYARSSTTSFNVARYRIPVGGSSIEPIRLLALGDSYISGEGAYSYRDGTDTSNNKCHQSTISYPYLLGASLAAEYHSAACSGAVTGNIIDPEHPNQLKKPVAQNSYSNSEINYAIQTGQVGTIEQLKYISSLKPNTIILSIGGNDIGFADVVKRCVLSFAWDPCYHKQSERKSLLLTIYSKFSALKATYSKILSEAPKGARLYVTGYPQVVNPTGNCGANVHFDDSEKQFAALLIERLNETLKTAAESSGAVFVDVSGALVGHRLCDTHDDGVNGLTSGDDKLSIGIFLGTKSHSFGLANESYHPTALGHQLLSTVIAAQTEDLTKEPSIATNVLLPKITDDDTFISTGAVDDAKARKLERQEIVNANIVSAGQKVTVDLDAEKAGLKQGATCQVVFHSEEVVVADGTVPESGKLHLDMTVPKLTPGIHSVHVYSTDINGEDVDVTEDIYVIADKEDFDGDGIANTDDPLPLVNETGHVILSKDPGTKDDTSDEVPPDTTTNDVVNPLIANAQTTDAQPTVINTPKTGANATEQIEFETAGQYLPQVLSSMRVQPQEASIEKNVKARPDRYIRLAIISILVASCATLVIAMFKHKRSK